MKCRIAVLAASALIVVSCASDDNNASTEVTGSSPVESASSVASTDSSETTTDSFGSSTGSSNAATVDSGEVDERAEVAGQALADGDFTLMLDALNLSGVADEIRDKQITVFAPSDDAFDTLTGEQYSDLITNATDLDDVVRRHIIDGILTFDELAALSEVETIGGETLTVANADGVVRVGGAIVAGPEADALSGEDGQEVVVFGIDQVLLEAS